MILEFICGSKCLNSGLQEKFEYKALCINVGLNHEGFDELGTRYSFSLLNFVQVETPQKGQFF